MGFNSSQTFSSRSQAWSTHRLGGPGIVGFHVDIHNQYGFLLIDIGLAYIYLEAYFRGKR